MMRQRMGYYLRWALLLSSGAVVFQTATACDFIQTGLLAFIAGVTYYLAKNV